MKTLTEAEAYNRLAARCAAAEQCRSDLAARLYRWGIASAQAARLLDRLEQEGYIDAERYCRAFANDRIRFAGWGRNKVAQALRAKQLPAECIAQALDEADADNYEEQLRHLLAAKRRSLHGEPHTHWAKLMRYGTGRGFEAGLVARILAETGLDQDYEEP